MKYDNKVFFTKGKIKIILIMIILIFLLIIFNMGYKTIKNVNNSSSQEIVNNILKISEYEAKIEVEVKNNRTTNKYMLEQEFKNGIEQQKVIKPENIEGLKIIKNGDTLKIEDTVLNITKIIQNYEYLSDNCLDLSNFIAEYKSNEKQDVREQDNYIIMCVNKNNKNRYTKQKLLYIDKNTYKPVKMQIKDANNNTRIDIKYNEINTK